MHFSFFAHKLASKNKKEKSTFAEVVASGLQGICHPPLLCLKQ